MSRRFRRTYICDICGAESVCRETYCGDAGIQKDIPAGWLSLSKKAHICKECQIKLSKINQEQIKIGFQRGE